MSGPPREFLNEDNVNKFIANCKAQGWRYMWLGADVFILITGVLANTALLWLFVREKKRLSAAKVLALNLVVMDFFFLFLMPFSLIFYQDPPPGQNDSGENKTCQTALIPPNGVSLDNTQLVFDMFNMIGCPLLLTCMCVERYLAVMRPMLYLRVRKWEHRAAVCAAVWVVTFSFCLSAGILKNPYVVIASVSVVVSFLFVVMVGSLGTIMWSLWQQTPAHPSLGGQGQVESPLKRQAVKNVLTVVVPAVVAYLPVLLMVPAILYILSSTQETDPVLCSMFMVSQLFPRLGVLIGPLFYLSKAKQMCCLSVT